MSSSGNTRSMAKDGAKARLHIDFPPVKDKEEVIREQQAVLPQEEVRKGMEADIPPVIRSVLELVHLIMSGHSHYLRASPGFQGGLFYRGKPYCFASGFRDSSRPRDMEDKGNHLKLKDPLVYGILGLPIASAYLCELHGKEIFDLEKPLIDYLPMLHNTLDTSVTARSILSFTTVLDDAAILKDAGAHRWKTLFSPFGCATAQSALYAPVEKFFSGGGGAVKLSGKQQRENLVQYVQSAPRMKGVLKHSLPRGSLSHFSVALLIAAVETQLRGSCFEDSIKGMFFERAQSYGTGYGTPRLWRDPSELFYQPTGLARQHSRFAHPIPEEDAANCAPSLFNASMNLYAPVEDYGKLLMLSLDTILDARSLLGCPDETRRHYDLGVECVPRSSQLVLQPRSWRDPFFLPTSSSFRYSWENDLGCFGVASCGTRGARLFASTLSRLIQHLFVKHILENGIDAEEPPDLDNPTKSHSETEEKFKKVVQDQQYNKYFKNFDGHTRF